MLSLCLVLACPASPCRKPKTELSYLQPRGPVNISMESKKGIQKTWVPSPSQNSSLDTVVVWMRMAPRCIYLNSKQLVNCLRKIRWCDLVRGGGHWGVDFKVSNAHEVPSELCLPLSNRKQVLSYHPAPCLPACCQPLCHDDRELTH